MKVCSCSSAESSRINFPNVLRQRAKDFKSLNETLKAGDLTRAQSAFEAVQKDVQNSHRIARSGRSEQINQALTAVGEAIKSGDTEAAKGAFDSLTEVLKGLRHGHPRRHHRVSNEGDSTDSTPATIGDPTPVATLDLTLPVSSDVTRVTATLDVMA